MTIGLLSVAEFNRLSQPAGRVRQELHHGELVESPPVKKLHTKVQRRLVALLGSSLKTPDAAEHEVWVADVAVFSVAIWEQTPDDDYFVGVPAVVIEVLSPSNTAPEMLEREEICLQHGGREFWLVDPQSKSVKVVQAGGQTPNYRAGVIESGVLVRSVSVSDIFVG